MPGRQLELSGAFAAAGRLAVLGIGSSPGKTNLMAAEAVIRLGSEAEGIDSIDVCAAGRDPAAPDDGGLRPPYAIQTLLDELILQPVILRDGPPVEIEPLAAGGAVDYGEPIGQADTIFTLHSELATFGESFGCQAASFRLSLAPAMLERLRALAADASPEAVATATPAAACVRLLARGALTATGALPPESCIDPGLMFAELEQRGCTFSFT